MVEMTDGNAISEITINYYRTKLVINQIRERQQGEVGSFKLLIQLKPFIDNVSIIIQR